MNIWQSPGAREFMDEIFEILQSGNRHLVIYLPSFRMQSFVDGFGSYCRKYYGGILHIRAEDGQMPPDCLGQCFDNSGSICLENLGAARPLACNILIELPKVVDAAQWAEWELFFDALCCSAKQFIDYGSVLPWRMLILVPSHLPSMKPDSNLEIVLGSGFFRGSDLEYSIERNMDEYGVQSTSTRLWLSALCHGLARADPEICNAIFELLPISFQEIISLLEEYPLGNIDDEIKKIIISFDNMGRPVNTLDREKSLLQDLGILEFDTDNNYKIHPAALARAKRANSIERLVVQGQTGIYLPLVQEAHNFICRQLGILCGDGWNRHDPESWPSIETDIGPLWGYMNVFLRGCCGGDLLELATLWRNVRHTLAHGNMLAFADARKAIMFYESMSGARTC